MFNRNGRYQPAIRGLIAASILFLGIVGVSDAQASQTSQGPNGGAANQAPLVGAPNALVYKPSCGAARAREDAEYCEQAHGARAAESQARWAFWQLIVGALGVAAVVATLIYTARATKAAETAAEAAQASVGHQSETSRRQLRAYVFLESAGLYDGTTLIPPNPANANKPSSWLLIKNSGQTPAYKVTHWSDIRVLEPRYEHTLVVPDPVPIVNSSSVGAGCIVNKSSIHPHALSPQEIAQIAAGTHMIYVYGRIEYADAFGERHFTNYRLSYWGQYPAATNAVLSFSTGGNYTDEDQPGA